MNDLSIYQLFQLGISVFTFVLIPGLGFLVATLRNEVRQQVSSMTLLFQSLKEIQTKNEERLTRVECAINDLKLQLVRDYPTRTDTESHDRSLDKKINLLQNDLKQTSQEILEKLSNCQGCVTQETRYAKSPIQRS